MAGQRPPWPCLVGVMLLRAFSASAFGFHRQLSSLNRCGGGLNPASAFDQWWIRLPQVLGLHDGERPAFRDLARPARQIPQALDRHGACSRSAVQACSLPEALVCRGAARTLLAGWPWRSPVAPCWGSIASASELVGSGCHGGLPRLQVGLSQPGRCSLARASGASPMMSFTESIAKRHGRSRLYEPSPNPDRELLALGLAKHRAASFSGWHRRWHHPGPRVNARPAPATQPDGGAGHGRRPPWPPCCCCAPGFRPDAPGRPAVGG